VKQKNDGKFEKSHTNDPLCPDRFATPGTAKGIWNEFFSENFFQIGSTVRLGILGFCLSSLAKLALDLPLVPIRTFEPETVFGSSRARICGKDPFGDL
jgi:hypothetical protein